MAYRNTLQADALKLVAKKLQRSLAVEGELPEDGLAAVGNSGTGKTHVALGLAACQRGMSVGFTTTAAALVHELMEARDESACSTSSGNCPA